MRNFVFINCILNVFFVISNCKTADESSTGSLLKFPYVSDGSLYNVSWEVAPSQFGFHDYGGSIEGYLILPANTTYHTECTSEPVDINPYVHWINDWEVESSDMTNWILLIDRGSCYFVNKIYNAQLLGASAVIVLDTKVESLFTMWEPDDYTSNITIPSILLGHKNAITLMNHLGVLDWNGTYVGNTIYPTPEELNWTIAKIEWGLPHYDDRVEWELWTSSNDPDSIEFKKNFRNTSLSLSAVNDTVFTPHMYILNGTHWTCTASYLPCRKQCSNSGRYCAVDPENDLYKGLNGIDVVQENLRQLCVWNYSKANNLGESYWWDYSILWNTYCFNGTINTKTFTANCSFEQMKKLDANLTFFHGVKKCINESGGYPYKGGVNTLLEYETRLREDSSVYALPMVIVNEFLIHGDISCNVMTTQGCQVLDAICAGFINGTQPPVCMRTPSPTPVTCSDSRKDCAGVCYGSNKNDSCGQCLLVSSPLWNYCVGCDGVPYSNKTTDCDGVCGGDMAINECGNCLSTSSANFSNYGKDCSGVCNGKKLVDRCDQCLLESDSSFDSCVGCDEVVNSGKATNPCGYCLSRTAANFSTYGQDCAGVCNGKNTYDRCGQCLLETDASFDSCVGCDGITNSNKATNPCGYCLSKSHANFSTYGTDCRGVCDSTQLYQYDECGNCLTLSDEKWNSCVGCDGKINSDAVWKCGVCVLKNSTAYYTACNEYNITAITLPYYTSDNSNLSTIGILIISGIAAVGLIILLIAGCVIYRLWKRQKEVDEGFKNILHSYQMMDDTNIKTKKETKNKKYETVEQVPDEEDHEQTV